MTDVVSIDVASTQEAVTVVVSTADCEQVAVDVTEVQETVTVEIAEGAASGGGVVEWLQFADDAFSQTLLAGVRSKLALSDLLALSVSNASATLLAHDWFEGGNFRPYGVDPGGKYRLRINLDLTSTAADNVVRFELDIGGTQGVIEDEAFVGLFAGVAEVASPDFDFYTFTTFLANGGEVYATADFDCTLENMSVLIVVERVS